MTQTVINVHEAKTHFSRLLERAHAGEEIVLAKAGRPYARLVPLDTPKKARKPGALPGIVLDDSFFDPMSEEDLADWEGGR
ncbi:MAG: type II toxin-antitoxin system Phd/YefM family antitoxin [Burkholderiales bacterium]|jgi:prevent-host-death family protein|nr:type II toxin-antitoxin system Phd/YefM family antitoxin [Burkholderiales bacterium]MBP7522744.1 type II toxin-antitoxin system Phd/YefM family antitoxin [Leptothrix sp. (in: b-proteobacteria)]